MSGASGPCRWSWVLADFYGVSVDYLMGRTDVKRPIQREKADAIKMASAFAFVS